MGLKLANNALSRLSAGISPTDVTVVLVPGGGAAFPTLGAGDYFPATIVKADGTLEIVKVTARATDVLTVVRAQENTTAKAFNAGDRIELRLTAGTYAAQFAETESSIEALDTRIDAIDTRITAEEQHTQNLYAEYGGSMIGEATYAQLRAYNGNAIRMPVLGRAAAGDGGQGVFVRTGSAADNSGTVLKDALNRSWERDYFGGASIEWFYSEADGGDWGPALIRALTACDHVVLPKRPGDYTFTSEVSAVLTGDKIIDFNGQACVFSGAGRVKLSGQLIASGRSLAANAARYATSVQLNSTAGVQAGDLFYINTSIAPSASWPDTKKDLVRIRAVSGNSLILDEGLNFHYTTADAGLDVLIYRPVKLTMIRPNLQLIAADGEEITKIMFRLEGLRDVYVDRPEIKGSYPFNRSLNFYRNGIYFYRCWGGVIQSPVYEAMSYPCGIYGGSRHFIENDVHARYMHHAHADVGDWSSDYLLDGMHASDGYQSLNTHVCFRATAANFSIRNDYGNSNWRVCGGSLKDGYLHSTATDAAELPQFQNNDPAAGYEYINADADFNAENITFDTPKEVPFGVRYGRTVKYSGVKANAVVVGFSAGEVAIYINGECNQIGTNNLPSPDVSSVKATLSRYDAPSGRTPTVTNAAALTLPMGHSSYLLSGSAVVTYISPVGHDSKTVNLVCTAYTEFKDNVGNLVLVGDYIASGGRTISLVCVGNTWYEVGRSPN